MEELINQAFMHVDVIGKHVHAGHYDLTGPNGEIILPQVWESTVEPDWSITMHLWPIEEKKDKERKQDHPPGAALHHTQSHNANAQRSRREVVEYDRWGRKKSRKRSKSVNSSGSGMIVVPAAPSAPRHSSHRHRSPAPPPPAPAPPPAVLDPSELPMAPPPPANTAPVIIEAAHHPGVTVVREKKERKSPQQVPGFAAWMVGSMGSKGRKK